MQQRPLPSLELYAHFSPSEPLDGDGFRAAIEEWIQFHGISFSLEGELLIGHTCYDSLLKVCVGRIRFHEQVLYLMEYNGHSDHCFVLERNGLVEHLRKRGFSVGWSPESVPIPS